MNKIKPRLLLTVFVLLICFIASGTAFAQIKTQGGGGGTCCAVSPTMDIETITGSEPTPVEMTRENGISPYFFLEPSVGLREYSGDIASESNRYAIWERRLIRTRFDLKDLHTENKRV